MIDLAELRAADIDFAAPFRVRAVGGAYLLTNFVGGYIFLNEQEFERFAGGRIEPEEKLYQRLRERDFIARELDTARLTAQLARRKSFLGLGPHLHIVTTTLRCNQTCVYCHASRADMGATETDMSLETADHTVDLILATTSPDITVEFQGGEPLANFEVVRHIVQRILERNEATRKRVQFALVTNLSLMDEDKLTFLLDNRVQICTSIDGPATLHNGQRVLPRGDSFESARRWIVRINEAYAARGLDPMLYHVEALLTTTRQTLTQPREVVDAYRATGCQAIFLRPMDPFGFAQRTGGKLGHTTAEFLAFYREATNYILQLNLEGVQLVERFAAIFLTKILRGTDPNFLDVRSPCGAGIGQVVYSHDGTIFTCDEGRMVQAMGDARFQIGDVRSSTYGEIVGHEMVQAMALASNVDASPDCISCVYHSYCGLCPVYNYVTQGSLHGSMRENGLCQILKGIQDYLFGKLRDGDPAILEIFERWTTVRERDHFVHLPSEAEEKAENL